MVDFSNAPKSKDSILLPEQLVARLRPLVGKSFSLIRKVRTDGANLRKIICNLLIDRQEYAIEKVNIRQSRQKGKDFLVFQQSSLIHTQLHLEVPITFKFETEFLVQTHQSYAIILERLYPHQILDMCQLKRLSIRPTDAKSYILRKNRVHNSVNKSKWKDYHFHSSQFALFFTATSYSS